MSLRNRLIVLCVGMAPFVWAQGNSSFVPVWWAKYQHLLANGADTGTGPSNSAVAAANVNVSNECGPQSETFIAIDSSRPSTLAAGSNEIFRLPMRGYFTDDDGSTWGGVDLPLPAPIGANGTRFGSDPSLAFDTQGNVFYSYIVVFFGRGKGINGTEVAVARSGNGGKTYPFVNFFSFSGGSNHFNDKPMITTDTNLFSPFRDNIYVAWDAASGGSPSGGLRFARSRDHGATFTVTRIDNASGPGRVIAANPFVGPKGEVYAAWNDIAANTIAFNRSFDGGETWGIPSVVAKKSIAFDIAIPAISFRRALIYPACDADRSSGPHNGRLYCSWVDLGTNGTTDVFTSFSDDRGATWSKPQTVTDRLNTPVDRFYQWLSVDPMTGQINISFYDTRNDTTGQRFITDVYFTHSTDGISWLVPNLRVSTASSNEHDCNGLFPCEAIDYGNQYGDYEGLVSFGGISHAIWTDSREQQNFAPGCRTNLAMEEIFTATVR